MRSVYDNWNPVGTAAEAFAGANTPHGFESSYDTVADERAMERVYIIKGGAGTGKSTLMRRIGAAAEKHGAECRYYLCGSDPDSLDCVVIGGKIAVLDGTAPHVREMKIPGASSSIIDVSKYWDASALRLHRGELEERAARKSAAYASCYRWLAAADEVHRERLELAGTMFDEAKARGYITRLLGRLGKTESGGCRSLWSYAVTMKGRYRIPQTPALRTFAVSDYYGTAPVFLNLLCRILAEKSVPHTVYHLPLSGTPASVTLDTAGVTVTASGEGTAVNMKRFVTSPIPDSVRGRIRLTGEITESCLRSACDALEGAAGHHFAMEEIYKPAVDFRALTKYGDALTREILSRL